MRRELWVGEVVFAGDWLPGGCIQGWEDERIRGEGGHAGDGAGDASAGFGVVVVGLPEAADPREVLDVWAERSGLQNRKSARCGSNHAWRLHLPKLKGSTS